MQGERWLDYKDPAELSESWIDATEEFREDGASTTVHRMQGERGMLRANYDRKDWDAMQVWIQYACAQWTNSDQEDAGRTSNSDYATGTMGAITRECAKWVFAGQKTVERAKEWQQRLQSEQAAGQNGEIPPCLISMFVITQVSEGSSIALTATVQQRQSPGSVT